MNGGLPLYTYIIFKRFELEFWDWTQRYFAGDHARLKKRAKRTKFIMFFHCFYKIFYVPLTFHVKNLSFMLGISQNCTSFDKKTNLQAIKPPLGSVSTCINICSIYTRSKRQNPFIPGHNPNILMKLWYFSK